MSDYIKCRSSHSSGELRNYDEALICKNQAELDNPGQSFHIESKMYSGVPGGTQVYVYHVAEGLTDGCVEGEGGVFDEWTMFSSYINERHAKECADSLNRLNDGKTYKAVNTDGDDWVVRPVKK